MANITETDKLRIYANKDQLRKHKVVSSGLNVGQVNQSIANN